MKETGNFKIESNKKELKNYEVNDFDDFSRWNPEEVESLLSTMDESSVKEFFVCAVKANLKKHPKNITFGASFLAGEDLSKKYSKLLRDIAVEIIIIKNQSINEVVDSLISLNPREMADLMCYLDDRGKLEFFLDRAMENDIFLAKMSYYEKWLKKDQRRILDNIVREKKVLYGEQKPEDEESLPLGLEKRFNREELETLVSNLCSIQLTFGCSNACPMCGVDAVPGVRDCIPYGLLANLFKKFGKDIGRAKPLLYFASEPSDYKYSDEERDWVYADVHQLAKEYSRYNPRITTRNVEDADWRNFVDEQGKRSRYSINKRESRIKNAKELLKGKSIIAGKFQPIGISLYNKKDSREGALKELLDDEKYFSGSKERVTSAHGFQGITRGSGVLLTPRGVYNVISLPGLTLDYPQGAIIVGIKAIDNSEIITKQSIESCLTGGVVLLSSKNKHRVYRRRKMRQAVFVKKKNGIFKVWIDDHGIIHKVEKIEKIKNDDPDISLKEDEKKAEEVVQQKLKQYIEKAILNGRVTILSDNHRDRDFFVSRLKLQDIEDSMEEFYYFQKERNASQKIDPSVDGSDEAIFSWIAKVRSSEKELGVYFVRIKYDRDSDCVHIEVFDFKNSPISEGNKDKANDLFKKSISEKRTSFFTDFTEEQKEKIIQILQEVDINSFEFIERLKISGKYRYYKIFEIDEIGEVYVDFIIDKELSSMEVYVD